MTMTTDDTRQLTRDQVHVIACGYGDVNASHQRAMLATILGVGENPGTVYGIVRHVSRSGMSRRIDLYFVRDGELYLLRPEWYTTHRLARTGPDGYQVNGAGMDMVFHLLSTMFEQAKHMLGIDYDAWPYQEHMPRIHVL